MTYPAVLFLRGKKCLVAGAGKVAERKAKMLCAEGAIVTAVAPQASRFFLKSRRIKLRRREFRPADLKGMFLVIAATGDRQLNARICALAAGKNILANNVSGGKGSSFSNMAHAKKNGMVAAVFTGGRDVKKAVKTAEIIAKKIL